MGLTVNVDASQLEQWAKELSARGMRNAIRRAVDQSATAARKVAMDVIAKDIGAPKARIKDGVSKVKRTTQTSLRAEFTASKLRVGILNVSGASVSKGSGLHASTHRLTGGGSANLDVRKAFVVTTSAGGRFVAIRRGRERLPLKGIYAEMPNTAMAQDNSAAQTAWKKAAEAELSKRLAVEVQKQLLREGIPYSAPADTGD